MSDPASPLGEPNAEAADAARVVRLPSEPLLDQHEIDALAGYAPTPAEAAAPAGTRAVVDAGAGPREPLPMLGRVFDEVAHRLVANLRSVFADDVDVRVASLRSVRYGAFIEDLTLPAKVVTFRAEPWEGSGLVAMGPDFGWLVLDALLGAGRNAAAGRVASRPFSNIESAILVRIADAVLGEAETAFGALAPVSFRRERTESDPRLGNVAASGELAFAAQLALTLGGRSAAFVLLLPAATLEPVRGRLGESFAGARGGRGDYWSDHMATEVWQAAIEAEAILHETALPLRRILNLAVGETLMFDMRPTDPVELRCGGVTVTRGRMGRVEGRVALQVLEPVGRAVASGLDPRLA